MFQSIDDAKSLDLHLKEWFIIIENKQEGPFSLLDLKKDYRFTPDTLVWRKGFQEWTPARFVYEMKQIFKDEPDAKPIHEPEKGVLGESGLGQQDQVTLTLQQDPYQLLLWILLLLLIFIYTFYQSYYQ
jgi:hypothetical protein